MAASPLGLKPHLLLRTVNGISQDLPSPSTGNVLLDRLAGAEIRTCTPDAYRQSRGDLLEAWADELRSQGQTPYVVPEGGSNALGSMGYVRAAYELADQFKGQEATSVVVPTGSGGTLAGIAIGLKAAGLNTKAWGIAVCDDESYFRAIVDRIAKDAAKRFGTPDLDPDDYGVISGYQGRGYALSTEEELTFLSKTARHDGLVLDPVYTGKAFRGMVDLCRRQPGLLGKDVTFIHTGGMFGLFAKAQELDQLWAQEGG